MKFNTIVKIVTALAAAVGAIYIVATFGDKIVEWAKNILGGGCCKKVIYSTSDAPAQDTAPAEAEAPQGPAQEEVTQEPAAQEEAAPQVAAEEEAVPVADEEDFEG